MTDTTRRAVLVLGAIAILGGLAGLVVSSGQAFTEPRGARVWELMHLNPLGSWVSIRLGALPLLAGWQRSRVIALVAAAGFLAAVLAVTFGANRPTNPLGGTASTVGFYLGPGAGLLALALAERAAAGATTDDLQDEHKEPV
jgi:hypothetical protein